MAKAARVASIMIAIWFAFAGVKGIFLGIGALAAGRFGGELGFQGPLANLLLYAGYWSGIMAIPHLLTGGLFLIWKRFPTPVVSVVCLADAVFWGVGISALGRPPILFVMGLALFGLFHLAAGAVFLHPSVRRRETS